MGEMRWIWSKDSEKFWFKPANEVLPLLFHWENLPQKILLDIGCGLGRHSRLFANYDCSVMSIDNCFSGLSIAKSMNDNLRNFPSYVSADMVHLPFASFTFDYVLAFHTIYHTTIAGLESSLSEIHRVLKINGDAFLSFASKSNLGVLDQSEYINSDGSTYIPLHGNEAGIPHTFVDEYEVMYLLRHFRIVNITHSENIWPNNRRWHFFIQITKGNENDN